MKAVNIKWDTDGDKELLEELPKEIEIPNHLIDDEDIGDYLSDQTGFCHHGFQIIYNEKDVKSYIEELLKNFGLEGVELADEDIAAVLKDANENQDLITIADSYLYRIRNTLDAGLESGKEEER